MKPSYHCQITVPLTPAEAYNGISRVSKWWSAALEGSSTSLNDIFIVAFGETSSIIKVTEADPHKRIVWHIEDCHLHLLKDKKEWKNTSIIWELHPDGNSTRIDMTHEGLVPDLECYKNCEAGWDYYVKKSLASLLTNEKGFPDQNNDARREKNIDLTRRLPRAVADIERGMVLASTDLVMPPGRVFTALTEASEIHRWWGSGDTYRMTNWNADTRTGGTYTVVVVRPDGNKFPASGKFLEVTPPHKLSHTRIYEWDHPTLGRRETTITYLLDPIPIGTRLTVRHEGFEGCTDALLEHMLGWERVLEWLDAYLYYEFYFPKTRALNG